MKIEKTNITGVFIITPTVLTDERGYFFRSFSKDEMNEAGMPELDFIQMNESYNEKAGTFRGFHFQNPPYFEDKLIRCVKGAVMDYAIDLRKGSPTFLKHISVELNQDNHKMIFIPKGFAHGFITLKHGTVLLYHHTVKYQKGYDNGIHFKDSMLDIALPCQIEIISEKDKNYPYLTPDFKGYEI
jgi:dTDP-4-dehydrorhamnose 3,5-epimerase